MSKNLLYTEYHPRWFRSRMSTYWWLTSWSYFVFILRELSSIFIAWFVVYLLLLVRAVSQGDSRYQQFLGWSGSPVVLLLNLVSLGFVVLHTVTWFNLTPKAVVLRVRGKRVPASWIIASNYVAWVLSSALVAWLLLGG
jgi:fumarate reductase subunit C